MGIGTDTQVAAAACGACNPLYRFVHAPLCCSARCRNLPPSAPTSLELAAFNGMHVNNAALQTLQLLAALLAVPSALLPSDPWVAPATFRNLWSKDGDFMPSASDVQMSLPVPEHARPLLLAYKGSTQSWTTSLCGTSVLPNEAHLAGGLSSGSDLPSALQSASSFSDSPASRGQEQARAQSFIWGGASQGADSGARLAGQPADLEALVCRLRAVVSLGASVRKVLTLRGHEMAHMEGRLVGIEEELGSMRGAAIRATLLHCASSVQGLSLEVRCGAT